MEWGQLPAECHTTRGPRRSRSVRCSESLTSCQNPVHLCWNLFSGPHLLPAALQEANAFWTSPSGNSGAARVSGLPQLPRNHHRVRSVLLGTPRSVLDAPDCTDYPANGLSCLILGVAPISGGTTDGVAVKVEVWHPTTSLSHYLLKAYQRRATMLPLYILPAIPPYFSRQRLLLRCGCDGKTFRRGYVRTASPWIGHAIPEIRRSQLGSLRMSGAICAGQGLDA